MLNLIDINLLPEKEKKGPVFVYSLAIILLLFLVGSLYFFFSLRSVHMETESTVRSISQTEQLIEVQQTKLLDSESTQGMKDLERTVESMMDYPVKTVPVLNELISLLPPRGFIQSLEYSGRQTINASIQFDSSREAAYYLHHLKEVEWIREAEVLEMNTETTASENMLSADNEVAPRYLVEYSLTMDSKKLQESKEAEETSLEEGDEE
jgi:type IV pilus assembly protein PilN